MPAIAMSAYHPDYVLHAKTGFLAISDEDLAQKLDLLLRDSEIRHAMASAAVRHSQQFDWDEITKKWAQLFGEVVAERQRA